MYHQENKFYLLPFISQFSNMVSGDFSKLPKEISDLKFGFRIERLRKLYDLTNFNMELKVFWGKNLQQMPSKVPMRIPGEFMVFHSKIKTVMEAFSLENTQFLPVKIYSKKGVFLSGEYWFLNCQNYLEIIDTKGSIFSEWRGDCFKATILKDFWTETPMFISPAYGGGVFIHPKLFKALQELGSTHIHFQDPERDPGRDTLGFWFEKKGKKIVLVDSIREGFAKEIERQYYEIRAEKIAAGEIPDTPPPIISED